MVRVELSRAWSRRLVQFLLLASIGAVIAISVGVFATHRDEEPSTFANVEAPQLGPTSPDALPPRVLVTAIRDRRFHYTDLRDREGGSGGIVTATSAVFLAVAVVAGASLVGAEYRFATMTTLLTWEPRRVRVLVAKLLAVFAVAAAVYLLLEALLALALLPVAVTRGTLAGAGTEFARGLAGEILRGTALAGGLAALGACLATLGRNTSAALGGLFVYVIGVEGILRARAPQWARWFLVENLSAVLTAARSGSSSIDRPVAASGLLLAAYLVAAAAFTVGVFARRDVT